MGIKYWAVFCVALFLVVKGAAHAQDRTSWILIKQVEDSRAAKGHARLWALQFDGVHALRDKFGGYSVAVGPFDYIEAQQLVQQWAHSGQIPESSSLASSTDFAEIIWPPGADDALRSESVLESQPSPIDDTRIDVSIIDDIGVEPTSESLEQARQRESRIPVEVRADIQLALRWFDHYSGEIDGQFGPATRQAISEFQSRMDEPATGYLTTYQQNVLVNNYEQELRDIGFYVYSDANAGIRMMIPGNLVEFARYNPPFAVFESADERNIKLLIVSLKGGADFLQHLYEVVQMFDAVPREADKSIGRNSFRISGSNETTSAFASANLSNGQIKGFLATWPKAENILMNRIVPTIRENFRVFNDRTLDDLAEDGFVSDSFDLLAGLETRKPDMTASGFYIDPFGHVLTTWQAVANCERIRIESDHDMVLESSGNGPVAVLAPVSELSPIEYARFAPRSPRYGEAVSVSGFSFGGKLGAPTLTKGMIRTASNSTENEQIGSISVDALQGDAGGPILNSSGTVVGMLLPREFGDRQLPEGEFFYSGRDELSRLSAAAGRNLDFDSEDIALDTSAFNRLAADITVLIECFR
ncbi:MAG: serine protease [Albidovulum sp.]|nr:serine protease [Albidovulum sp.]MDE0304096.1 serine protease [Albidovulum sp.]MDE0533363.1 serine protease [Albidovulum sp.]